MKKIVTVAADPAWTFGDKLEMDADVKRGAASNYRVMNLDQICALANGIVGNQHVFMPGLNPKKRKTKPVLALTLAGRPIADDAFLWLWTTGAHLLSGDVLKVCKAWDFEPKQLIPWVKGEIVGCAGSGLSYGVACDAELKLDFGMGHYTRACAEFLILATRGRAKRLVRNRGRRGIIVEPRREHSRKPDGFFDLVEAVTPGPYFEMFARRRRKGWDAWGDELR